MNSAVGIYYRSEAYQETTRRRAIDPNRNLPTGLMGREVASHGFLDALLKHGTWSSLEAILESEQDRQSFVKRCSALLGDSTLPKHVHLTLSRELSTWLDNPTVPVVAFPYPPEDRFCWARQSKSAKVAFSGVTHTLCSQAGVEALWRMFSAPWHPYDRLVCTSTSVLSMIRDTTAAMQDYLSYRNASAKLNLGLELIPLGVNTEERQPTTAARRYDARRRLGIGNDRLVLLFVGRLSHHAKSQPYPLFLAAEHVAKKLGTEVYLVQCGWFSNDSVRSAYERTAGRVAPNVRLITVDGMDSFWRMRVWDVADIFVSLADSIQETFGLTNIEAMAHGLPVVASDWNGYRDTVVHGETGFLIPTAMLRGSLSQLTSQLVTREINYDEFLASASQSVIVSIDATCQALECLATQPERRLAMGMAGRRRAEEHYAWPKIIRAYEAMWQIQSEELAAAFKVPATHFTVTCDPLDQSPNSATTQSQPTQARLNDIAPAIYPPIEVCFSSYPTAWIDWHARFTRHTSSREALSVVESDPLLNHSVSWNANRDRFMKCFNEFPESFSIHDFPKETQSSAIDLIAWLLKYDLVRLVGSNEQLSTDLAVPKRVAAPWITFVTTCMSRLNDLRHSLPLMTGQSGASVVVVDYSCPEGSGDWVRKNFPQVTVVDVPGKNRFDRSEAKNAGVRAATTSWICLVDADILMSANFAESMKPLALAGSIVCSDKIQDGTGGSFMFEKHRFDAVGGHDPHFSGWGEQDADLVDALRFSGAQLRFFPASYLQHRDHDEAARTRHHDIRDRRQTQLINRSYRTAKWDWARLMGQMPDDVQRREIRHQVESQLADFQAGSEGSRDITIRVGSSDWGILNVVNERTLCYRIS